MFSFGPPFQPGYTTRGAQVSHLLVVIFLPLMNLVLVEVRLTPALPPGEAARLLKLVDETKVPAPAAGPGAERAASAVCAARPSMAANDDITPPSPAKPSGEKSSGAPSSWWPGWCRLRLREWRLRCGPPPTSGSPRPAVKKSAASDGAGAARGG